MKCTDYIFLYFQISRRVFELMRSECLGDALPLLEVETSKLDVLERNFENGNGCYMIGSSGQNALNEHLVLEKDNKSNSIPFESYKRRTTVIVRRETFLDVVFDSLSEYKYVGPNQRADLLLACR